MNTEITESGLTDKQERFAHEYLIDQNASAACLRAGYSAHSKGVQAAQLMANPAVRGRIRGLLEELYSQIKLDALQLMQERMRTAFFDPRRLFDANSEPIPFKELDAECAGVVLVSYDTRSNGDRVTRVRQPSRAAALSALERRFMQFMRMQREDTITERENADFQLSLGRDPVDLAAGGVVRFTPDWVREGSDAAAKSAFPDGGIQPPSQPSPSEGERADRGEVVLVAVAGVALPDWGIQPPSQPSPSEGEGADRGGAGLVPVVGVALPDWGIQPPSQPSPLEGEGADRGEAGLIPVVGAGGGAVPAPVHALAKPAAAPVRPAPAKVCVPTARASKKGWSDAWGNIDVDHPQIPPEVKARELEKRRRKAEEEAARNNPGLLLKYAHSAVGQPNPPWPRPLARSAQRFAITEDDPYGAGGSDY